MIELAHSSVHHFKYVIGLQNCSSNAEKTQQTSSSPNDHNHLTPKGLTAGIAVSVTVVILIPLVILSVIGYRYRKYGRCVWPNICEREELSITVDQDLCNNSECEMGNTY